MVCKLNVPPTTVAPGIVECTRSRSRAVRLPVQKLNQRFMAACTCSGGSLVLFGFAQVLRTFAQRHDRHVMLIAQLLSGMAGAAHGASLFALIANKLSRHAAGHALRRARLSLDGAGVAAF